MSPKPNASKLKEKSNKVPQANPSLASNESQPDILIQSPEVTDLQPKMPSSKKRMKKPSTVVRRSERIQNTATYTRNENHVIEEITVGESEEENEDEPLDREEEIVPKSVQNEQSLVEKIEHLAGLLKSQEKQIEALKSKESGVTSQLTEPDRNVPDTRYRTMYIDSQKKIEELTLENRRLTQKLDDALSKLEALPYENRQLALKLENALGKLEIYEKGSHAYSEVLEKLKDVIMVANMSKFAETALNAQALHNGLSPDNKSKEPRKKRQKATGGNK